jgi:hypothetical protein
VGMIGVASSSVTGVNIVGGCSVGDEVGRFSGDFGSGLPSWSARWIMVWE